jgi:hypothetical protein
MTGLYVNPCATSLALYLTISLFLFLLWMKNHFDSMGKILRVGITDENTSHFLSNCFLPFDPAGVLDALCHGLIF